MNSAEYKQRLLHKLDCLINVLETAIGKIETTLSAAPENRDRLERIKSNLNNTLEICRRARTTLLTKIEKDRNAGSASIRPLSARPKGEPMTFRNYVELSSIEEFRKFRDMKAITNEEIRGTDFDELARKLLEEGNDS